jgi:hypothetical protein
MTVPRANLVLFPSLGVRVRELRRLVVSGAPAARVRRQARVVLGEHRRRLRRALISLHALKPLCAPQLKPLWLETIDSAILLLHLNARDFRGAISPLAGAPHRVASRT